MRKRIQKDDNRRSDAPRSNSGGRSTARNFSDRSSGPNRASAGDRKPYEGGDRSYTPRAPREGGERRPYNREGSSDRPYTPRAPREDGERRPYNREGSSDRPYTPRAPREGGERRPYNREGSSDRPYTPRAPREDGERRPYNREGSGDRPYTPRSPREDGERRPYNREGSSNRPYTPRAPREDGERRPYNREGSSDRPYTPRAPREDGERRPYNREGSSDRPYTPREPREDGEAPRAPFRRAGGDFTPRPAREESPRNFEPREERKFTPRDDDRGNSSKFSKRDTFKPRNRHDQAPAFTPAYKLDRYKETAPAKIQKKIAQIERRGDDVRLNRFIANAGICSRRDADKLIEAGEIKVNNKVVTEMGYQVGPTDVVKYGNRRLNREKPAYVLLNKPKDFLTTTEDPQDRKTVMELVKNAGESRIYPVGRLDRNTTGLILLTNDGELADKLTHPSNEIEKIYQAELDKPLTDEDFEKIVAGLKLEDGEIKVDDLAKVTPDGYVIGVKIHSGKNRIVRRIFEHLGYEVTKLDRTTFAGLTKKDLPRGSWRYLTERELVKLKYLL
ncbi:MAG: pseudouridine synthase [Cytophagaceae bacterium]|nr:pseudouridine synthase [Cytophagaceae bacterium]